MTENNNTKTYTASIAKNEDSTATIQGKIEWGELLRHRKHVLEKLGKDITIKGFRKGHIPEKTLIDHVGEMNVLEEMAQHTLSHVYPQILEDEKLHTLGRPHITVKKLAQDNPLEFEVHTALMPTLELPDYKNIAHRISEKKIEITVDDKEVEEGIGHIREQWGRMSAYERAKEKEGERKIEFSSIEIREEDKPAFDDAFVKQLGDFKDVNDFKKRFKENIEKEKKLKAREQKRVQILDEIAHNTTGVIPNVIVEAELDKMTAEFEAQATRSGVTFDEYLTSINKTRDDLRREWKNDALLRAKSQLILREIAERERIIAKKEDIKNEVEHLKKHHPDADEGNITAYVETILTNAQVFEFLENIDL